MNHIFYVLPGSLLLVSRQCESLEKKRRELVLPSFFFTRKPTFGSSGVVKSETDVSLRRTHRGTLHRDYY